MKTTIMGKRDTAAHPLGQLNLKSDHTKWLKDMEQVELSHTLQAECKPAQIWKTVWPFLKTLNL